MELTGGGSVAVAVGVALVVAVDVGFFYGSAIRTHLEAQ